MTHNKGVSGSHFFRVVEVPNLDGKGWVAVPLFSHNFSFGLGGAPFFPFPFSAVEKSIRLLCPLEVDTILGDPFREGLGLGFVSGPLGLLPMSFVGNKWF